MRRVRERECEEKERVSALIITLLIITITPRKRQPISQTKPHQLRAE
jgi:hypothetical protein